jgi:hypothetical protein
MMHDWLVAFVLVFTLDFTWAFYVKRVQDGAALAASGWAASLFVISGCATIGYTHDPWLLVPCAAGAFCGTYFGVVWTRPSVHTGPR